MRCWTCEKTTADRGGICRICRRAARIPSSTPRRRLSFWKLAGALVGVLSLAAGSLAVVSPPTLPWSHRADLANRLTAPQAYVTTMVVEQLKRKVYPYSIVPGGAENLFAAKRAMTDPAIKAHYASVGVDLAQLKEVKLTANLSGYVSYRWGDKIYWTAKKITLRAGEKVFTDGTHVVRARCLNCYSMLPMQPTRPHEPTELALDAPIEMPVTVYSFPLLPLLAPALPVPPGELTPSVPVLPAGGPSLARSQAAAYGFR